MIQWMLTQYHDRIRIDAYCENTPQSNECALDSDGLPFGKA